MTRNGGTIAALLFGLSVISGAFGQATESPTPGVETPQDKPANSTAADHVDAGRQMAQDLASTDPAVQSNAISALRAQLITDPNSDKAKAKATRWCRRNLERSWLKPLLAAKQYDLIHDLVTVGLAYEQDDSAGVDSIQRCWVETLLASGKYDDALPAAKSYYNVCLLQNTGAASDLMIQALANSRAKQDMSVIRRFKLQQAAAAQPPDANTASSQPTDLGDDVLKSIQVDASLYQQQLDALDAGLKTFPNITAHGNLLLLADQPADARQQFELSLDLANDPKQLSAAVANIARSIRAKDGAAAANAYIISLRQANDKTP